MEEAQVASDVVDTVKPVLTKGKKAGLVIGALALVGLATFGIVKLIKHKKSQPDKTEQH